MHDLHDLASTPEGSHRKPPTDDLGEGAQIRPDPVDSLGAPVVQAQGLHLVEDQQGPAGTGGLPQKTQKLRLCGDHSPGPQHRFDDHRRQAPAYPFQNAPASLHIVVGEVDHQLGDQIRNPGGRDGGVVMGAVIAALEPGDLTPPGIGAGQSQSRHGGLGARIGEPDQLHRIHPPANLLRQPHLVLGGRREGRASLGSLLGRFQDVGMGVSADQGGVVVDEVDPPVAVDIHHVTSLTPGLKRRKRRKESGGAGGATRQHPLGAARQLDRPGIGLSVFGQLPIEGRRDLPLVSHFRPFG